MTTGCGAGKNSTQREHRVAQYENIQVLRFRWKRELFSNIPDFNVPEFYEEHDRFAPVENGTPAFDTDERKVFVGASIGGFYCLEVSNGKTVWRYDLDDAVGSTPYYDSTRKSVFFGADDGNVYRLHSRSGRLIWKTNTGAEVRRTIHMQDDTLFVVNADNTLLAVDPEGGEIVWRYHREPVEGFSSVGYSDVKLAGNQAFIGFSDGYVVSLELGTGVVNWEADLAAEVVADAKVDDVMLVDVDATPVVANNTVVASSLAGGTYGLDAKTGNVRWVRSNLNMVTGAAYANDEVYLVRSGKLGIEAINPQNGQSAMTVEFGAGLKSDPVVYDDLLLISDSEAGLYMISGGTGRVLDLLDMHGGFFARPVEYAGYMLIMGNWSTLLSFAIN